MAESFITQTGAHVTIHEPQGCRGGTCPFHNPSDHHMTEWPVLIRTDMFGLTERICEHRIEHPDPDSLNFLEPVHEGIGIHSCDGCCRQNKS